MNGLSDIYFFDSNIMLFAPFANETHTAAKSRQESLHETTEHKLSNLEQIVELNDDVYEIVPVDPLANCGNYAQNHPPVPYSYVTDGQQVNEGLAVLEILYNHPIDAPEYIDINELGNVRTCKDPLAIEEPPSAAAEVGGEEDGEEDDDDVIFVAEYNRADVPSTSRDTEDNSGPQPRRNPIRKARKNARDLAKELLYAEDYALLESSSEEDVVNETLKKSVRSNASLSMKEFKKWPVNGLHERPEYNDSTKRLEKFDYTIRQIKNSVTPKKPPAKITKKPAKRRKYYPRKKTLVKVAVEDKVPVAELQDLVESTLQDVRQYIDNVRLGNEIIEKSKRQKLENLRIEKANKENIDTAECIVSPSSNETQKPKIKGKGKTEVKVSDNIFKSLELLKSQAVLFQVINNASEKGVMKYFRKLK